MKKIVSKALAISLCLVVGFTFTGCDSNKPFDYDLSQYVKVAKYTGMKYDKSKIKVTQASLAAEIQKDLQNTMEDTWITTGKVKKGDTVKIDYYGTMNGVEAEGTSATDQELIIGSHEFIDGFETGLIGKEVGSTVVLNLRFPKSYSNNLDYAGKKVQFTVTIKSKKSRDVPELTEEWVAENTSFKSVKEYKDKVKSDLTITNKQSVGAGLLTSLTEKSKILKYPTEELNQLVEASISYYTQIAESNGTTYEKMVKKQMNKSVTKFEKELKEQAKTEIAQELVAFSIAKEKGLEAQDEDVDKYLEDLMSANGLTEKTFKSQTGLSLSDYKEKYSSDIMIAITVQNVEAYLVKKGVAK